MQKSPHKHLKWCALLCGFSTTTVRRKVAYDEKRLFLEDVNLILPHVLVEAQIVISGFTTTFNFQLTMNN